ncbi:LapA family protein [Moraxella lincolnii]|uniref:LapA family protein n=1 Tax=Lwoffella lincolnii TaxID=90241 RepID=UPI0030CF3553
MRVVLMVVLVVFFAYALGLVIANSTELAVNLLFYQAPAMNLGLLLIIAISLGIGIFLSLLWFKVLQNKWEMGRLNRENTHLKTELARLTGAVEQQNAIISESANLNVLKTESQQENQQGAMVDKSSQHF